MEPIEGDVRHVLHVRRPPYLHPFAAAAVLRAAPEQRLPQQREQQRQERPLLLLLLRFSSLFLAPFLDSQASCRSRAAAAAAAASSWEHVAIGGG
uniref:Uncharacterized protein n=1 Tax=Oryza nivara TaxID=4536 RepID=A0A0E0J6X4_ORYNI